jgi:hypothetical protein
VVDDEADDGMDDETDAVVMEMQEEDWMRQHLRGW